MFCPSCGAEVSAGGAERCPECGMLLAQSSVRVVGDGQSSKSTSEGTSKLFQPRNISQRFFFGDLPEHDELEGESERAESAKTEEELANESASEPGSFSEVGSEPKPEPEPKPKSELEPEFEPKPKSELEPEFEPKPKSELEPEPEHESEPKQGFEPEQKHDSKLEPKHEPVPDHEPEPEPGSEPESKPDSEPSIHQGPHAASASASLDGQQQKTPGKRTGIIIAVLVVLVLIIAALIAFATIRPASDSSSTVNHAPRASTASVTATRIDKSGFIGEWELVEGTVAGLEPENLQALSELGLHVILSLDGDGTGMLALFENESLVSWEATSSTQGVLELNGSPLELEITQNSLIAKSDAGEMMRFKAYTAPEASDDSASPEAV